MNAKQLAAHMNKLAEDQNWSEDPAGIEDRYAENLLERMAGVYPKAVRRITWNSRYYSPYGEKMVNPDYGFTWR